jgi:hypothetical protein
MQALFAAIYLDEIAAVQRSGGEALVRETLSALDPNNPSRPTLRGRQIAAAVSVGARARAGRSLGGSRAGC